MLKAKNLGNPTVLIGLLILITIAIRMVVVTFPLIITEYVTVFSKIAELTTTLQ